MHVFAFFNPFFTDPALSWLQQMMNFIHAQRLNFPGKRIPFSFLILVFTAGVMLSSCKSIKPYSYFKQIPRDTVLQVVPLPDQDIAIRKGDVLSLQVTSLSRQEDEIFNAKATQGGYEVGKDGEIYVQRLGKLKVAGLNRRQLKEKLEADLKLYLKDPVVGVGFANHRITIIGQVGKPQVLPMPEERMSLLDALAQSGNTLRDAELTNIIVIRDSSHTHKIVKHLNLEDKSIFSSPFYYLQPNDVLLVNADERLATLEQNRLRYQQLATIVFQATTLGILIYQTFFR